MKKILTHLSSKLGLILFVVVLLLPAIDRKLHFFPVYNETEKRNLAPRPLYHWPFPVQLTMKKFEAYWNDHFGGRNFLIHLRAQIWLKLFMDSPVSSVVVGKEGWLFYKSESKDDGPGINDYQGLTPLTDPQLNEIVSSIEQINTKLKSQGITLIVTVAPNKSSIYPNYLPFNFPHLKPLSRLDQLVKAVPPEVIFVDLRSPLITGKQSLDTYQKTDSHWNDYGAFLAVQTLLQSVPEGYSITAPQLTDYNLVTKEISGEGDLSSMMAARGIFRDLYVGLTPRIPVKYLDRDFGYLRGAYSGHIWELKGSKKPRLLMFGDSFRNSMAQFLYPHFSTSYIMGFSSNYKLNNDLIKQADPDIIIWEVAERYLDRLKQ